MEVFYSGDRDHRIHVTWLERIELKTDRKGKHSIVIRITDGDDDGRYDVDEDVVPNVTNLIAEIESAKAAFQFD